MLGGYKWTMIAGVSFLVVLAGWFVVGSIQDAAIAELQLEALTEGLERRNEIEDAIRNAPRGVDDAINFLHDRFGAQ